GTLLRSGSGIEPYFVAAVARAVAEQQGISSVSVELESHGRDVDAAALDVSRTIGWLTALYPVKLEHIDPVEPLAQLTTRVHRSLIAASETGLGQSARRFLVDREADVPQISVNYLGVLDPPTQRSGICVIDLGVDRSPDARRSHLFEFDSFVRDNHLSVQLRYSSRRFSTETAQSLLDSVLHTLTAAVDCTPATGGPVLDATGSGLSEAELAVFLQTLGQA
ncbi:condensation domain-containing protein, partial [Propioniciclava flava]